MAFVLSGRGGFLGKGIHAEKVRNNIVSSTSIWPSDYLSELHEIERQDANHLIVFLICPFKPEVQFQGLLDFCNSVCEHVGGLIGARVECLRADSFATPNVIHGDIWNHIQMADVIIADVSGTNGNVMLELGVAAAIREKEHVIVIHDRESDYKFLFDISPARHLSYNRTVGSDLQFQEQLTRALLFSLAPAPYVPYSHTGVDYPVDIDLTGSQPVHALLSPSNAHRRLSADGLEFGSFYIFRSSWLSLGQEPVGDVRIQAKMRFSELRPEDSPGCGWIGIMLRSQHFFANLGHLVYVLSDGRVRHTKPVDEFQKEELDPILGQISNFKLADWITFDLRFDTGGLHGKVADVGVQIPATDMPFVHNAGVVRFQTYRARACLRTLRAERLD